MLAPCSSKEPDWTALACTTCPARLVHATSDAVCEKDAAAADRRHRRRALALEGAFDEPASRRSDRATCRDAGRCGGAVVAPVAAALVDLRGCRGAAVWFATRPAAPVPPRVSRLHDRASGAAALTINGNDRDLAITPDGSRVIYVGNRGTQLFVRALDALEPVAVFTGAPRGPFVSPTASGSGSWTAATC